MSHLLFVIQECTPFSCGNKIQYQEYMKNNTCFFIYRDLVKWYRFFRLLSNASIIDLYNVKDTDITEFEEHILDQMDQTYEKLIDLLQINEGKILDDQYEKYVDLLSKYEMGLCSFIFLTLQDIKNASKLFYDVVRQYQFYRTTVEDLEDHFNVNPDFVTRVYINSVERAANLIQEKDDTTKVVLPPSHLEEQVQQRAKIYLSNKSKKIKKTMTDRYSKKAPSIHNASPWIYYRESMRRSGNHIYSLRPRKRCNYNV